MSEATRAPTMRRFGLALPLLIFAILAGLFWYALHAGDPSLLPSPLIGKPVPDFTLPPIEGLAPTARTSRALPRPTSRKASRPSSMCSPPGAWSARWSIRCCWR